MARALIVGCGCRGREPRAGAASTRGWRRPRDEPHATGAWSAIDAAGIEAAVADPDRIATVLDAIEGVALIFWLLGSATASPRRSPTLHGPRLERLLEEIVDTPVRGLVYELTDAHRRPSTRLAAFGALRAAGRTLADPVRGRRRRPARLADAWLEGMVGSGAGSWSAEPTATAAGLLVGAGPGSLVGDPFRRLVEIVGEQLDPDRRPGDDEDDDRVGEDLPRGAGAVAAADHLAALVEAHRVDLGLLMTGEPLPGVVLLDHRVRADRGRGGLGDVLCLRHLPIHTDPGRAPRAGSPPARVRLAAGCRNRSEATLAIAVTAAVLLSAAARAEAPAGHYPWAQRVAAAKRWAEHRQGRISFAVVDESGRMHGFHPDRVHNSASVVKVLFMVALLREPDVRDDALGGLRARRC